MAGIRYRMVMRMLHLRDEGWGKRVRETIQHRRVPTLDIFVDIYTLVLCVAAGHTEPKSNQRSVNTRNSN